MTLGLNTTVANNMLNGFRNTAFQVAAVYIQLHIGEPGDDGTSNVSAVTTRELITLAAAAGGAIAMTGTNPSWSMTSHETITHVSAWTAATSGSPLWSAQLGVAKPVDNLDELTLISLGIAVAPLMAD